MAHYRSAGICLNEQTGRFHTWERAEAPTHDDRDIKPAMIISRQSYATYDEAVRAFRGERKRKRKG